MQVLDRTAHNRNLLKKVVSFDLPLVPSAHVSLCSRKS